jgi:hypothetical protein
VCSISVAFLKVDEEPPEKVNAMTENAGPIAALAVPCPSPTSNSFAAVRDLVSLASYTASKAWFRLACKCLNVAISSAIVTILDKYGGIRLGNLPRKSYRAETSC